MRWIRRIAYTLHAQFVLIQPLSYGSLFVCRHGFGVGPYGAKFKFAQQYLKPHDLHAPAWHLPTFAETRLSHSIDIVRQFMLKVLANIAQSLRQLLLFTTDALHLPLQTSEQAGGKPWNVIGSSTGALIASHIARTHPHLVHRMLLISPAINLADWFEAQGQIHSWSAQAPDAANAFMPNNTGDGSGGLQCASPHCRSSAIQWLKNN